MDHHPAADLMLRVPRTGRWLAIALLVVSALVHAWMFPGHAGLVAPAGAHPDPGKTTQPTTATTPPSATPARGRAYTFIPAGQPPATVAEDAAMATMPASHRYIGWLFFAGAVALGVAARGIHRQQLAGWRLAALVCAAMNLGLLTAVTVGLPGGYTTSWEPQAVACIAVQTVFLLLWGWVERTRGIFPTPGQYQMSGA